MDQGFSEEVTWRGVRGRREKEQSLGKGCSRGNSQGKGPGGGVGAWVSWEGGEARWLRGVREGRGCQRS